MSQANTSRGPSPWPIYLLLAIAVIVPAAYWQRVWFGSRLSDEELARRLARPQEVRDIQHACEQLSRRMQHDPEGAGQFYELLLPLAEHSDEEVRAVVAWCMGEDDTGFAPFRQSLLALVGDPAPRVRYNAALALARHGDSASRPVLQEMLSPYPVRSDWEGSAERGTVVQLLGPHDVLHPRARIALIDAGTPQPVVAPLRGQVGRVAVAVGQRIGKGELLCTIKPEFSQLFEALRAFALVGEIEDLEHLEPYRDPVSRFSSTQQHALQTQTSFTMEAIRRRASAGPGLQ